MKEWPALVTESKASKVVDDKVAEVIDGAQTIFNYLLKQRLTMTRVDGKEAKEVAQQTANDVDQMRRPLSSNCISANLIHPSQVTNCARAFANGSLRQTRPQIITSRVLLIKRERQPGSFKAASSPSGK
jgi:hypothetical protein